MRDNFIFISSTLRKLWRK